MSIDKIREQQRVIAQAFEAWGDTYNITNPPPEKLDNADPTIEWWSKTRGVWWSIVWALGLYIASRTGWGIHKSNVAEGFDTWVSLLLTIPAVWGIEGFIANYGFHRPRKLEMGPWETFLERSLGFISVMVGVVISSLAGMKFSMNIAVQLQEKWGPGVDTSLSLLLGVGLTFVLFGVSEFIGRLRWVNENKPMIEEYEHRLKMADWRKERQTIWEVSATYLDIMGDDLIKREKLEFDLANANRGRAAVLKARRDMEIQGLQLPDRSEFVRPNPNRTNGKSNGSSKTDIIKAYLTEQATAGIFPELQDIMTWFEDTHGDTIGKSTVSEARTAWSEEYDAFRGN